MGRYAQGGIPNGEPESFPVVPRPEMRSAETIVQGQTSIEPPAVHGEELRCVIPLIVQVAEVRLLVLAGKTREQVCIRFATAAAGPVRFRD